MLFLIQIIKSWLSVDKNSLLCLEVVITEMVFYRTGVSPIVSMVLMHDNCNKTIVFEPIRSQRKDHVNKLRTHTMRFGANTRSGMTVTVAVAVSETYHFLKMFSFALNSSVRTVEPHIINTITLQVPMNFRYL